METQTEKAIELLKQMIATPSTSGNEKEVSDIVLSFLKNEGYHVAAAINAETAFEYLENHFYSTEFSRDDSFLENWKPAFELLKEKPAACVINEKLCPLRPVDFANPEDQVILFNGDDSFEKAFTSSANNSIAL